MKITGKTVYYFNDIESLKLFIRIHKVDISFAENMLLIYGGAVKYYRFYKVRGEKRLRWSWGYAEDYREKGYNIVAYGYQRTE